MKSICVFCGSSPGLEPAYLEAARRLGALLARENITLVYGGGKVGLMGEIANAVMGHGGQVFGVIPQFLLDKEVAHTGLTRLHVVNSMHERKALMAELSEAFVALPGGVGTLEEFIEVLTWAQLGLHRKPCGLLNVLGYFDPLVVFFHHAVSQRFMREEHWRMLLIEENEESLLQRLKVYQPVQVDKWLDRTAPELERRI